MAVSVCGLLLFHFSFEYFIRRCCVHLFHALKRQDKEEEEHLLQDFKQIDALQRLTGLAQQKWNILRGKTRDAKLEASDEARPIELSLF